MARLRKFVAYRRLERPYTRKSKYKAKQYVRASPNVKIVRFEHGDKHKEFERRVALVSKQDLQIRQEAIESMRMGVNRYLEKNVGKNQFFFRLRLYPFHVLRENPLASGAGADRLSTGMQKSFGKPIGVAARVKTGKQIAEIYCFKANEDKCKYALDRSRSKLPGSWSVITEPAKGPVP